MENTLENKEKFFAQYWGQDVLSNNMHGDNGTIYSLTMKVDHCKDNWLLLTPLSQITDEDAIEIAGLTYGSNLRTAYWGKHSLENDIPKGQYKMSIEVADYLRSKGYALPFMGLSVDQLIEYGWVKLK